MRLITLLAVAASLYITFSHGQFAGEVRAVVADGLTAAAGTLREAPAAVDKLTEAAASAATPASAASHSKSK